MLKQNQDNISIRKEDEICYGQKFAVMETVVSRSSFQRF